MEKSRWSFRCLILSFVLAPLVCRAQKLGPEKTVAHNAPFAFSLKMSTLGAGIEFARPIATHSNLRAQFYTFIYGRPVNSDGITYNVNLTLRSLQVNYDWFPFHGRFHISPGLVVYDGNQATANLSVPAGQPVGFATNTVSSPKDPIHGDASIRYRRVAPAFLVGWGNPIRRKPHHFSVSVDLGVIFLGQPKLTFDLSGSGCDAGGLGCSPIDTTAAGVSDIANEQSKINGDISSLRYYPVVSIGFGYAF